MPDPNLSVLDLFYPPGDSPYMHDIFADEASWEEKEDGRSGQTGGARMTDLYGKLEGGLVII
jgi:hypothetical protein